MSKEVYYKISESDVNIIFKLCADIIYPKALYTANTQKMADTVIRHNQQQAQIIDNIINKITDVGYKDDTKQS